MSNNRIEISTIRYVKHMRQIINDYLEKYKHNDVLKSFGIPSYMTMEEEHKEPKPLPEEIDKLFNL